MVFPCMEKESREEVKLIPGHDLRNSNHEKVKST